MLESLYTGSSTWITTTALTHALKAGATFTGDIILSAANVDIGTNSLKFTSTAVRTLTPTILEALYTNYNTWLTVTPTSLPATTFTGDVTLGVNSLRFTNAGATIRVINQAMLESLYTGSTTWTTATALTPYALKAGATFMERHHSLSCQHGSRDQQLEIYQHSCENPHTHHTGSSVHQLQCLGHLYLTDHYSE